MEGFPDQQVAERLRRKVVVLTGAGISAASGLPTFRGSDGLYEGLNPYELASPEAFAARPVTVWNWYLMRIHQGKHAEPNAAHYALADLENMAERCTLITSNVDPLHERAGSKRVFKLHGNILETRCTHCLTVKDLDVAALPDRYEKADVPLCSCGGRLRPNVVWFGEYPNQKAIRAAEEELPKADLVLEVGTSGVVSYGFTELAVSFGVPVVRVNPEGQAGPGVLLVRQPAEEVLAAMIAAVQNPT
jgi:NAD-dependent deacetylase